MIFLALKVQRSLACPDATQNLDILAGARERLAIGLTMPAFHHLRARKAQAQQNAPAAEQV
jgi:hypothetical protein